MITLLGSLLGFLGSMAPNIFSFFQDRSDKKHERLMYELQIQNQDKLHLQKIEAIWAESDAERAKAVYSHDTSLKTDSVFISALRASVRPVITYLFFLLYAAVKAAQLGLAMQHGDWMYALVSVWRDEDMGLWSAIISFWFGNRMMEKRRVAAY